MVLRHTISTLFIVSVQRGAIEPVRSQRRVHSMIQLQPTCPTTPPDEEEQEQHYGGSRQTRNEEDTSDGAFILEKSKQNEYLQYEYTM